MTKRNRWLKKQARKVQRLKRARIQYCLDIAKQIWLHWQKVQLTPERNQSIGGSPNS